MSVKLFLIRHGESLANKQGIIAGQLDSPLSDLGKDQARDTRDLLKDVRFDKVYSSDLTRAIETAQIIYPQLPPIISPLLKERNYGIFQGKSSTNYLKLESKLSFKERFEKPLDPSMESNKQVLERVLKYLETIISENKGKTLLISTHGEVLYGLLVQMAIFSYDTPKTAEYLSNGAFLELSTEEGKTFKYLDSNGIKLP